MSKQIIVTPTIREGTKRFEPVILADHPTYELVSENEDGTWTIIVPDD